jgi:Tol biopolymer transport system component/serine/threonine protein kinase
MPAPDTMLQGRYRIVRQIGEGGMGSVYAAIDTRLNATVAVKQTLAQNAHIQKAFEAEAHLLARLQHAILPKVTDYFTEDSDLFLVMEFIEGSDFDALLTRQGTPFPVNQVVGWADQLLDALEYLHSQDPPVIHRDIKPQNLKLTPAGNLYLIDFGLARGAEGTLLTGYTAHYAPLEQFQGLGTDARGDLYSLAMTLHQLLTNTDPQGVTTRAGSVLGGQPDPQPTAHQLNPQVPPDISAVLEKAMAIRAEDRYSSATQMRAALNAVTPGITPAATQSAPRTAQKTIVVSPPAPSQPAPSQPAPSQPAPSQPAPSQPAAPAQPAQSPAGGTQPVAPPPVPPAPPPAPAAPPAQPAPRKSSRLPFIIGTVLVLVLLGGIGGVAWAFFSGADGFGFLTPATTTPPAPTVGATAAPGLAPTEEATPDEPATAVPAAAALSNQIVFVSNRDGNREIYVMNADGADPTNLTASPADETAPAVAPDGTRIAYVADDNIYVMNADGADPTNLTADVGASEAPTWSPDGEQIAFVLDDTIYVMNADGSDKRAITEETGNYRDLDWSPDGTQFVFDLRSDIYRMNADGSDRVNLTSQSDARDIAPAWSPNGEQIAFASNREDTNFDVYIMSADGSNVERLTENGPWLDQSPTWSPDGTQIAFRSSRDRDQEIYRMNADGSDPTNLTNTPDADDTAPDWSWE